MNEIPFFHEDINKILNDINTSPSYKAEQIIEWIKKEDNNLGFPRLRKLLNSDSIRVFSSQDKSDIAKNWFNKKENIGLNNLLALVSFKFLDQEDHLFLVENWINNRSETLSLERIKNFVNDNSNRLNYELKYFIIIDWLKKDSSSLDENKMNLEDLSYFYLSLNKDYNTQLAEDKKKIRNYSIKMVKQWYESSKLDLTFDDIENYYRSNIKDPNLAKINSIIFRFWNQKQELRFDQIRKLILNIDSEYNFFDRASIMGSWVKRLRNLGYEEDVLFNNILNLSDCFFDFDGSKIKIMSELWVVDLKFDISKLQKFLDQFYSSQLLQKDFIEALFKRNTPYFTKDNYHDFCANFVANLSNRSDVIDVLELILDKLDKAINSNLDVINLVQKRIPSRYKIIHHNFEKFSLKLNRNQLSFLQSERILGIEGLEALRLEEVENLNLSQLFSLFEINANFKAFFKALSSVAKEEIDKQFTIPEDHFYISLEEINLIRIMLLDFNPDRVSIIQNGITFTNNNIKDSLNFDNVILKTANISLFFDYLKIKISNFIGNDEVIDVENYQINFSSNLAFDNKTQSDINSKFKEILYSKNNSQDDVIKFLSLIFSDDEIFLTLSDDSKHNIVKIFNDAKFALAKIFATDSGLLEFCHHFFNAKDGCIANIGSHLGMILAKCALLDPADQILFSALYFKVIVPILNSGGDIVGSSDPLNNDMLKNNNLLIAENFPNLIKGEFIDKNSKIIYDPWEFILNLKGKEERDILLNIVFENSNDNNFNDIAASVATSFVMNQVIKSFTSEDGKEMGEENIEILFDFFDSAKECVDCNLEKILKDFRKARMDLVNSNFTLENLTPLESDLSMIVNEANTRSSSDNSDVVRVEDYDDNEKDLYNFDLEPLSTTLLSESINLPPLTPRQPAIANNSGHLRNLVREDIILGDFQESEVNQGDEATSSNVVNFAPLPPEPPSGVITNPRIEYIRAVEARRGFGI